MRLAIGLRRGCALSRSAVEHFDEGVYASNIYFAAPEYAYPLQRFYAPPLLPALIEAGMIVGLAAECGGSAAELSGRLRDDCGAVVVWAVVVWAGGGTFRRRRWRR